jgi:hypothetical protein
MSSLLAPSLSSIRLPAQISSFTSLEPFHGYLAALTNDGTKLMPDVTNARAVALFEQAASIEVTAFDPIDNRLVF